MLAGISLFSMEYEEGYEEVLCRVYGDAYVVAVVYEDEYLLESDLLCRV
jgi:hypothetical protein